MKSKKPLMSRRALLKGAAVLAATVTVATPCRAAEPQEDPAARAMRIRTREEVGYRDEPYLGRTCSRCVLYAGDGQVCHPQRAGEPEGWCTQWVPNTMG